ncbi:polar amino acid transport system permease protein [Amycolatopsis echigonensis]|uniref:Polar amino acid transport system permease protein n=1 Tax=Amycolatopsis echigonensis TaxID=2576905 RepID=A0A2N3X1R2_9PSEU|nr:polar amino acid transport system permease protein [Amycolatopsis niigatensis]
MSTRVDEEAPEAPRLASGASRWSPRRRQRAARTVQYAVFGVVLVLVAVLADWQRLGQQFLDPAVVKELFPDLITVALLNTVTYTVSGFAVGLVLGLLIALMRLSSVGPYRWVAMAYIELFRGLPALLIFIFVGVGVPLAFPGMTFPGGAYGQVACALGLVSAAYMAETIRAGIQAVPRGQLEASRTLGMSHSTAMRTIVLPQAFRIIVPPLTNELVLLFKDSSLVLFLGVTLEQRELTKFGRDLASQQANTTPIFVAGLCYLLITVPLGYLVRRLEARHAKAR